MPRINRIRIVNVPYDDGTKIYTDRIFEPEGKHTLVTLANGGGKTLLIQLLLQTVLPNTPLAGRDFYELFKTSNHTSHVMVEWLLDGDPPTFLLTGICATKGDDESGRIKFFTYTNYYKEANPFDIRSIPVNNGGVPTAYTKFQDIIRRASGLPEHRVSYFPINDLSSYRSHLETFNLYSKEWKSIQRTNNEEGGISGYFRNCGNSEKLMRNLIVPSMSEVIYESPQEEKQIAKAFASLRENLLKIPELEKNITIFTDFEEASKELLSILEELKNLRQEKGNLSAKLWLTEENIDKEIGKLKDEEQQLGQKLEDIHRQLNLLRFQAACLNLTELRSELAKQEDLLAKITEQHKKFEEESDVLLNKIKESRAVNALIDIKEQKLEIEKIEGIIKNRMKGSEELKLELNLYLYNYLLAIEEKIKESEREIQNLENEQKSSTENITILKSQKQKLIKAKEKISEEKGQLDEWLKNYKEKEKEISSANLHWAVFPKEALADVQNQIQTTVESIDNNHNLIKKMKDEIESLKAFINKKVARQVEITKKKAEIQSGMDGFNRELEEIKTSLAKVDLDRDTYVFSEGVIAKIKSKGLMFKESLNRELLNKFRAEEKQVLLQDVDYYRPNKDVLKLKEIMDQWGIPCIEGSKWLKEQPLSDRQKQAILQNNPLLPYSLIITEQGSKELNKYKGKLEKVELDSPVPLIKRNEERLEGQEQESPLISLFEGEIFMIFHRGYELFISGEHFGRYRDDLEKEVHKIKDLIEGINASIALFDKVIYQIETFTNKYDKDFKKTALEEIAFLEKEEQEIEDDIQRARSEEKHKNEEISQKHEENYRLEKLKNRLENEKAQLEDFLKDFQIVSTVRNKRQQLEESGKANDVEIRETEEKIDSEKGIIEKNKQKSNDAHKALEHFKNKLRTLKISGIEEDRVLHIGFEAVENKVSELEKSLEKQAGDIDGYNGLLESLRNTITDKQRYIETELGFKLEEVPERQDRITEYEIQVLIREEKKKQLQVKEWADKLNSQKTEVRVLNHDIQNKKKDIFEKYGREPEYSIVEDDLQTIGRQLELKISELKDLQEETEMLKNDTEANLSKLKNIILDLRRFLDTSAVSREGHIGIEGDFTFDMERLEDNLQELYRDFRANEKDIYEYREEVGQCYHRFKNHMGKLNNLVMDRFLENMEMHFLEYTESMYHYDKVYEIFHRCSQITENYRKATEGELERYKKNKQQLVEKALQQAERFYTELCQIDRFSIVNIEGNNTKMVRFELMEPEKETMNSRMESYFDRIISELSSIDKLDAEKEIEMCMTSANLLNVISDLERCRIKVFKPKETGIKTSFADWENVVAWSGGEKYTALFVTFITIISYIRSRTSPEYHTSKAILADNPFGGASSPHLLEIIFNLANRNNVQMICVTALRGDEILKRFDVVYSLVLRSVEGVGVVSREEMSAQIEQGFHDINYDALNGPSQINIFDV